ncbi:acetoacetate--CoA ligase [Egicoccus halophilus]|uniref:Acetoacetyl-CoA synthetase n=1 Tax=Egicoccus halophilus TaxID=1670830 RepID=A0A8J3AAD4_9ACTN|nr:acetoacetate--CoA ligase [Egicoccus halophilus]GGI06440.1 acetoacetyl-CoA synthetase [Egicoccus halophilus]
MDEVGLGTRLWEPPEDARACTTMGRFLDWAQTRTGRQLPTYADAWQWSVEDLEEFWAAVVDWFDLPLTTPYERVLADDAMPGAVWLPGARLNYAAQALRWRGDAPAIVARSQTRDELVLSREELRDQVARAAAGLRRLGVGRGDRVVGYLPNVPETVVAFLACAALGAVWSSCAPEFGVKAVVDRVRQIEPTVLLAVDGYVYGRRTVRRAAEVAEIRDGLPSLRATVVLPQLGGSVAREDFPGVTSWDELLAEPGELHVEPLPFDHPLYVLYSSGTTGLPKAIVHGHGGILLEHVKMLGLHHDLGEGNAFSWFTTTGWMMWNYLVSGLTVGATLVLFDGDPGHPDLTTLWQLAADTEVDVLGVGAPFLMGCRKAGLRPRDSFDLSHLRQIGSTGSPLPAEGFGWVREAVGEHVQVVSASGGTDVCTAFVAAAPLLPVHAGEIPCRCLGADVQAFAPDGTSVVGERGELVVTRPMPSMPVGFWNDPDGERYRAAYFEDFPGVWRHGDWLEVTERGTCIITGRSDATLNRGGVRMGTSEFYAVVEDVEGILDSLVVHLPERDQQPDRLVLFVVLAEGQALDDALRGRLAGAVRAQLSPRHVPDQLLAVPAVPRTISNKKMEVPVKRLLAGEPLDRVANPGAMANPESLDAFAALAADPA